LELLPYDEPEILANDCLIRRISDQQIVQDNNLNCRRISTQAFQASSEPNGGMSVDLKRLIVAAEISPHEYVTTLRFTGSVVFSAGRIRAAGFMVGFDPLPDNPYHGEVWSSPNGGRFSKAQQRELQNLASWYVKIPNVELR
jgi:hypothetical protein